MRSEQEANRAIEVYADTVKRLCMIYLKNYADTEDVFQNVFIKYVLSPVSFKTPEHEKAWIIRVTVNECKDILKSSYRRRNVPLEDIKELEAGHTETDSAYDDVIEAVRELPQKYKDVVYLHYYEGYSAAEIGKILHRRENTVYTHLARARSALKERLGDDFEHDT